MDIKQRKKCGHCRCLKTHLSATCELGYKVKDGSVVMGVTVNGIPQEPCPKPLTVSDYIEAIKNFKK